MGAALGVWVRGEGEVLSTTPNILFGQALVTADGETALCVWRLHAGAAGDPGRFAGPSGPYSGEA